MSEATYDIRICTYQKANGRLQTNITSGNGKKLNRLVGAGYVRVRVLDNRVLFTPCEKQVWGETNKVSDSYVMINNQSTCQQLKEFEGEYTARFNNANMLFVDKSDRTMVGRRLSKIAKDEFKQPTPPITKQERRSAKSIVTDLVNDQAEMIAVLKKELKDLEEKAVQIMKEMDTKEQELKKQEGILEALETALQKMKGGTDGDSDRGQDA